MFLGMQFSGDEWSVSCLLPNTNNINEVQLTNGIYDDLFATLNIDISHTQDALVWDFYTQYYAKFQDTLSAGNVEYSAENVSLMRIKRRKKDEHQWLNLCDVPINNNSDFAFEFLDAYAQGNQEYYYAVVPVTNNIEGNISGNYIHSEFDSFYLLDRDLSYHVWLNPKMNMSINKPSAVIETLGHKYPYYISNGKINYKTGSISFGLLPMTGCNLNVEQGYEYRTQFEEWLMNGKPKILKDWTGQIFMINITDAVSIDYSNWDMPEYNISFVEIGNALNQTDLYLNNFIDVDFLVERTV